MTDSSSGLWVYLSRTPLLWLAITLLVYTIAERVFVSTKRNPLANPVLHSIWILALLLFATHTPYQTYFDGAQFVHFLLGPATVALAVPLYENRKLVLHSIVPIGVALLVGSVTAIASVLWIAHMFSLPPLVTISIAPKSVTTAVAMAIAQSAGGDISLTVFTVIITGVLGAVIVTPTMNLIGMKDWRARGFAVGLAAHGVGTARAFQVHPIAGTFAGVGLALNALLTSLLVPLILSLF